MMVKIVVDVIEMMTKQFWRYKCCDSRGPSGVHMGKSIHWEDGRAMVSMVSCLYDDDVGGFFLIELEHM